MISVTVIALGKLKESYMRDFCAEYEKRLKAFCKINITELSPVRLSQNPSEGEIKKALDSEAALIKSKYRPVLMYFRCALKAGRCQALTFPKKYPPLRCPAKAI